MHFYTQKDWSNLLKQENTSKMNIIAKFKHRTITSKYTQVGRELAFALKGPIMVI